MTNLVIMTQNIPFGKDYREILKTVYGTNGHKDFFFGSLLGPQAVSGEYPVDFQDLLYRCLNPEPKDRPTIHDFEKCAWIKDANDTPDGYLA
jgi:serine/threonine protein kinase